MSINFGDKLLGVHIGFDAADQTKFNFHTKEGAEAQIDLAAEIGSKVIRIPTDWIQLQPTSGDSYNEYYIDLIAGMIDYADSLGIKVILDLGQTPEWALPQGVGHQPIYDNQGNVVGFDNLFHPPADYTDYANAAAGLLEKLGDKGVVDNVVAFEVWNEPNAVDFWGGSSVRAGDYGTTLTELSVADEYTKLLNEAYDAIKQVNTDVTVLGGSLASADFQFVERMYENGAKFDALAIHPYTGTNPDPDYVPREGDYVDQSWTFKYGIENIRDIMVANGDADKGLWLTEFGWQGDAASGTLQQQADYFDEAFDLIAEWDFVPVATAYRLFEHGLQLGLLEKDGTKKPAADVLKAHSEALENGTTPEEPEATPLPAPEAPTEPELPDTSGENRTGTNANDTIEGSAENDNLNGLGGDDTLFGFSGNDVINGGSGSDFIRGQEGDDVIIGGKGNDVLFGEAGNDTFIIGENDGKDLISNFSDGDRIDVSALGFKNLEEVLANAVEYDGTTFIHYGDDNYIHLEFVALNELTSDDFVFASSQEEASPLPVPEIVLPENNPTPVPAPELDEDDDTIDLNQFIGTAASEDIFATDAADYISGGDGKDFIRGFDGDDIIDGGRGNDVLFGEGGNDTYIFNGNDGLDFISNFQAGEGKGDVIQLNNHGITSFDQLKSKMEQWNGATFIIFDDQNYIHLEDVAISELHADDFALLG